MSENRNLKEEVTYWAPGGFNTFRERSFSAPVLLKGFWQVHNEMTRNSSGEEVQSTAVVYVSASVDEGGWVSQGDQTSYADPQAAPSAAEIKAYQTNTDLRQMSTVRKAYL